MANIFNKIDVWLGYVLTLISLISFIVAIIKAIKNKKYNKVLELMIGFIEEAENFTCKNGQSVDGCVKKEIVMSKLRTACTNIGYKFNETIWSSIVDNYVEFTLKVNQREQDKNKFNNVAEENVQQ